MVRARCSPSPTTATSRVSARAAAPRTKAQLERDAGGHQGDGTGDEPAADPQARDVLGDLEREQDGDQRRHGQRPAGEQARHLPAEGDEAGAVIVAEAGQDVGGEQAADDQRRQRRVRHGKAGHAGSAIAARAEAPGGDGEAGERPRPGCRRRGRCPRPARACRRRRDAGRAGRRPILPRRWRRAAARRASGGSPDGEAARVGLVVPGTSRRSAARPWRRGMRGCQPRAVRRVMSSSLRGVPSGLVGSKASSPAEADDLAQQARRARRWSRSAPQPTLIGGVAGVVAQQEDAGVGQVVDVQELAARRAGAPDRRRWRRRPVFASCSLRIRAGTTWLASRSKLSPGP